MNSIFDVVEPLPPSELLANYWHFLKSIGDEERAKLGPVEVALKSRTVARGWPVALKNQVLALVSEASLTMKSGLIFIDISDVSSVSFFSAHLVLPFATAGAISRSPLETRATYAEVKAQLVQLCEELRKVWPMKIYFDADPKTRSIDELTNLNEVLTAVAHALVTLQDNPLSWNDLLESNALYIVNGEDMKEIAVSRREDGGVELAFRFSRALPKNLDEKLTSLFSAVF